MKGFAALLLASCCGHEAFAMFADTQTATDAGLGALIKAKLKSKAEIEASMTMEHAAEVVLSLNGSRHAPGLAAMIRNRFAGGKAAALRGHGSVARLALDQADPPLNMSGTGGKAPKGYEALAPATELLNGMYKEAETKLDLSQITCARFERNQIVLMQEATRDVASFNGQAADARGQVLSAQAQIGMLSDKIPAVEDELKEHRRTCISEIGKLKWEIGVVTRDLGVVRKILKLVKCDDTKAAASLLQDDAEDDPEDSDDEDLGMDEHSLVECAQCMGGKGLVMLKNADVQPLINSLQSDVAKGYMQEQLKSAVAHDDSEDEDEDSDDEGDREDAPGVALTQQQVEHMTAIMQTTAGAATPKEMEKEELLGAREEPLPVPPQPVDCAPTSSCKLTKGSCGRLRDRFLLVEGGISDRLDELTAQLSKLEHYCEETDTSLVAQLASLSDQLREAQTQLAEQTKVQIDSESQAALRGRQHAELKKEYTNTMTQCCTEQNEARSEMCALTKIRGELYKIEGHKVFITDCQVSEWVVQECSRSCAGGMRMLRRSITVAPNGGAACPPLQAQEECNVQQCPVDCVLGMWSGWSSCSAKCGGGVRSRSRHIKVPTKHGGEPCGRTEETEACNLQSCNRNCVLGRWGHWSTCNKGCGGGHRMRERPVTKPALGMGRCPSPTHRSRRRFRRCNTIPCWRLATQQKRMLECKSKVDLVLVVDSSGSLGQYGWAQSKKLSVSLVNAFSKVKKADIKIALLEFSSRRKTKWITHLTDGTKEKDASGMNWFRSGTATDQALGMAQSELVYGRSDATPIVVVITDGRPSSARRTFRAARRLQKRAKLVWVPIGRRAPVRLIKKMAARPTRDHIVRFHTFGQLTNARLINRLIGASCPEVA